jgi:cyclic pyranopterin phosphate synthase
MPAGGIAARPKTEVLTFEEIVRLVRIFTTLGVSKIRLTGGEPLVRKGLVGLIGSLAAVEGIEEILLTTNGTLLSFYVQQLKRAGVSRINISLDTLQPHKFKKISRTDSFYAVMAGIEKAKKLYPAGLKLNVVAMRGINDDEITDFVDFCVSRDIVLRFIELMNITPLWKQEYFISIEEVKSVCEREYGLKKIDSAGCGPAEYYETEGQGVIGFISTDENNCRMCNRLRLTSCGELKLCLYEGQGFCLKSILREGLGEKQIREIIRSRLDLKKYAGYKTGEPNLLYMCDIGG